MTNEKRLYPEGTKFVNRNPEEDHSENDELRVTPPGMHWVLSGEGTGQQVICEETGAWLFVDDEELAANWATDPITMVRAYNIQLDNEERSPTGEDYNEILNILGV